MKGNTIKLHTCPGCAYPTLLERGGYEICDVCRWEDDSQDDDQADEIWGGPNGRLSLTENRLVIGKELNQIAEEAKGRIIDDPQAVLSILSEYGRRRSDLFDKLPRDADGNHPIFTESHLMWDSLLKQLIINK